MDTPLSNVDRHHVSTIVVARVRAFHANKQLRDTVGHAYHAGLPVAQIAEAAGVTEQTVHVWVDGLT